MLIDSREGIVRHCIYKRPGSENRLTRMREYLTGNENASLQATYFGDPRYEYYRNHINAASERENHPMSHSVFSTAAALLRRSKMPRTKKTTATKSTASSSKTAKIGCNHPYV